MLPGVNGASATALKAVAQDIATSQAYASVSRGVRRNTVHPIRSGLRQRRVLRLGGLPERLLSGHAQVTVPVPDT